VSTDNKIKPLLPGYERVRARMEALHWLVDHGHGQDERVDHGHDQDARRGDIQTLGALVRELLADGKVAPRDLGAFFNLLTYGEREADADRKEQKA
jgi:hypothetical protein